MEHIFLFTFLLLLHKSSNTQLYTTKNDERLEMRRREFQLATKKYFHKGERSPVYRSSIYVKKELMEFTQPPFKIPYAVKTIRQNANVKKIRKNIPSRPSNYTQLKRITFQLKSKGRTADELKNDERKREENRREVEKKLAELSRAVDPKKKLQTLERELEIKRELGRAALEPPKKEFVLPQGKINKRLLPKDVIRMKETLKIQPKLLAQKSPIAKLGSYKLDSLSEELEGKLDDDNDELNYDLDGDTGLRVRW